MNVNGPKPTGIPPGASEEDMPQPTGEQASDEEQAQYEQIIYKAGQMLYDEKGQRAVLRQLNQPDKEVFEAIAGATVQIIDTIEKQAKVGGENLSPDAMAAAAEEFLIPELMEMGQKAKIFPIEENSEEEQEQMAMAYHEAYKRKIEAMIEQNPNMRQDLEQEAQNFMAQGIAEEADAGALDPEFQTQLQSRNPQVAQAVHGALNGGPRELF